MDTSRRSAAERFGRLAVVLLLVMAGACGPFGGGVAEVSLADLADAEDRWDGRMVRTSGLVLTWEDPRHYWIEDSAPHRVELFPHEAVADLVGQQVLVEGAFTFAEQEGRRITVTHLEVLDPGR